VFSHLAAADAPDHDAFTRDQLAQFEAAVQTVHEIFPRAAAHVLNTHGIHRFGDHQHHMVRLGIGLYGVGAYTGVAPLEEVIQWKCRISQVGEVEAGASIGYGRAFVAEEKLTYATLPVGYADGLSRALSGGKGAVYIGGHRCPILGNVCMDMVMVDVRGIHVQAGDEVEILGPNQSATDLAQAAGTIGYEILTGIGQRVPRLYLKD
jgi:alanine racemase